MLLKTRSKKFCGPSDVAAIFRAILAAEHEVDQNKEHFWVLGADTKNHIKYLELVSLGVLDATLVHPREVFRLAVMQGVACIVIVHNHPSGDCEPSGEDYSVTTRLREGGEVLGIEVLDHIIVGQDCHYSFRDRGDW